MTHPELTTQLTRAWEHSQRAGWALADAIKLLRDDPESPDARGNALVALDEARKAHNAANSLITDPHDQLAHSLCTSLTG